MVNSVGDKEQQRRHHSCLRQATITRLRRLQQLCSRTISDSLPDALLFIGGADGKFNAYSQAVLKYLFLGTTGRDLRNPEFNVEHEALEECVLIVRRHDVYVLYSEAAAATILPIIARWPRCREYVLPEADGYDNELFERHKISAFRNMVLAAADRGASFGTPFPRGFEDFRDVEMWPLVQSFALEDSDQDRFDDEGGRFFTMQYKIKDMASALLRVFGSVDALAVEACVLRCSVSLAHHLSAMRTVLDKARCGSARLDVSEEDLVAPLQLLYDFGVMQDDDGGHETASTEGNGSSGGTPATPNPLHAAAPRIRPTVLLGARTSTTANADAQSSAKHKIGNTGVGDDGGGAQFAEHFVVEAEEPSTGLCICRTHFLATRGGGVGALAWAYRSLCVALPAAVLACSGHSDSAKEAEREAVNAASTVIFPLNDEDEPGAKWQLKAFVRAIDACRAPVLGSDGSCILYVKLTLSGPRGAVAVGDSYAVVPLDSTASEHIGVERSLKPDKATTLLLTGFACPASLVVWGAAVGDEQKEATRLVRDLHEHAGRLALGSPIRPEGGGPQEEVPATVLFADRAFSSVNGRLRLFSEGFSFWAPGCVPVVVSMAPATTGSLPVASAGIVDVPEIPGLLLLLVKFHARGSRDPLTAAFPFLESTETCAIPLRNDSSLLPSVLQAFNSWKMIRGEDIGHFDASNIPIAMRAVLCAAPLVGMLTSSASTRERVINVAAANLSTEVADLNAAALWAEYLPTFKTEFDSGRDAVVGLENEERGDGRGGVCISNGSLQILRTTVLLGLPGSGVLSLAAAVLRFLSEGVDWIPIVVNLTGKGVDELGLLKAIEEAVGDIRITAKSRVLVAIAGEFGASAACGVVTRWKNTTRRLKIDCCTTCVRSADAIPGQGGDERWRPFILDQCAVGWISNVVLAGGCSATTADTWAKARHLRQRLHLANPGLAFLEDCSAQYAGREALESILRSDVYESPPMVKARRESYGPSWEFMRFPGMRNRAKSPALNRTYDSLNFSACKSVELHHLPPPPPPPREDETDISSVTRFDGVEDARRKSSRAFQNLEATEKWKLLACLSTLFPEARVQLTGFQEPPQARTKNEAINSYSAAGTNGDVTVGMSGIKRASELARAKVQQQHRREQEVRILDIGLRGWLRESTSRSTCESRNSAKKCKAFNVVGVVLVTESTCGPKKEIIPALLEATPELISLNGLPEGVPFKAAQGEVVARACSGAELDSVGELLAVACQRITLARLEPKTRGDLSAAELDVLREELNARPLPEGWFFDGSCFVDYEGNRKQERPDMPEIIHEHLEALNR